MAKDTWKTPTKGMDKCEYRNYLKELYGKTDFTPLRECKKVTDEVVSAVLSEDIRTAKHLHDFVLECAKENVDDAKLLIRKVNNSNVKF